MKNYLKSALFCLIISLLFYSCEKEIVEIEKPYESSKTFDLNAYRGKADSIIKANKLLKNKIESSFTETNFEQRTVTSSEYGFSIDTTFVQMIQSPNYQTYTFNVERETFNPDELENYVITYFEDESYVQMLVSYPINEDNNELVYDISNATAQIIIDDSILNKGEPCASFTEEIVQWDSNAVCIDYSCTKGGNHMPGQSCDGTENQQPYTDCYGGWVVTGCLNGGGGSPSSGNSSSDSNPSSGGGNNNNDVPIQEEEIPVVPLPPNYAVLIETCINGINSPGTSGDGVVLTQAQIECLQNDKQHALLNNYLQNNNCSTAAQSFGVLAAQAICDGGEVDFEEKIIYDSSLTDFPCHKVIIEDAIGTCSPLTQLVLDIFEANDNSNLILKVANITANANTDAQSIYDPLNHTCNTTIQFDQDYIENATDLSIARTAIHESLHAIFAYMAEEGLLINNSNGLPFVGFEQLVQAYIDYKSGLPQYFGVAHHSLMSDFVGDMAVSLSNYAVANGYNTQNGNGLGLEFYKKLCWAGLTTTDEFLEIYPKYLDPNDANNNPNNYNPEWLDIKLTIQAEIYNQNETFVHPNGNIYNFTPKGSPANEQHPCAN